MKEFVENISKLLHDHVNKKKDLELKNAIGSELQREMAGRKADTLAERLENMKEG